MNFRAAQLICDHKAISSPGEWSTAMAAAMLADRLGVVRATQDEIAEMTKQSPRSVRRHFQQLAEKGVLIATHRGRYQIHGIRSNGVGEVLPVTYQAWCAEAVPLILDLLSRQRNGVPLEALRKQLRQRWPGLTDEHDWPYDLLAELVVAGDIDNFDTVEDTVYFLADGHRSSSK